MDDTNDTNGMRALRRYYADEIETVANLKSTAVVNALASVPREHFLPPGPWTIRGEGDFQAPPRHTRDADPRRVYHNVSVAIDASRMLFNGAPGAVAGAIDALAPAPGERVLHIGTGLGYYTAIIADCVGPAGRVVGVEVDEALAAGAAANLSEVPWAQIVHGDGSAPPRELFDAILINAGVTHILPAWLDALAPGGRLLAPITATMPSMLTIGKGLMVLVTRGEGPMRLGARMTGFVAIYSAVGVRDDATNALVGKALSKAPFAAVRSLRLDAHDPDDRCWVHAPGACLSLDP